MVSSESTCQRVAYNRNSSPGDSWMPIDLPPTGNGQSVRRGRNVVVKLIAILNRFPWNDWLKETGEKLDFLPCDTSPNINLMEGHPRQVVKLRFLRLIPIWRLHTNCLSLHTSGRNPVSSRMRYDGTHSGSRITKTAVPVSCYPKNRLSFRHPPDGGGSSDK